jgi:hypothetical protein
LGRKRASKLILSMFSTILGINLYKTGEDSYKQGFVFTYKSQGLKSLSMRKSKPKSSNPLTFFALSNLKYVDFTTL